jgi:hypothetical protein
MNNFFKLNNWDEFVINGIEFVYINNKQLQINYDVDYLIVCDLYNVDYCNQYIHLFKRNHRVIFIYECLMHLKHQWKIKYINDNFNYIFQNCTDLIDDKNIFWIPCWNLFIDKSKYTSVENKKKYCAISPIFDLGFETPQDFQRLKRIDIVKNLCIQEKRIHVYGHNEWENHIPHINFIGKLPNEQTTGLYGDINLEERIINKCKILSNYKFIIVFENIFINGYVTEKLIESLYSDSVVIYYGSPNIESMDNYKDLFIDGVINGHNYDINVILDIMRTMDNNEYKKRVNNVQLLRDNINYFGSSQNIKNIIMNKIKSIVNIQY